MPIAVRVVSDQEFAAWVETAKKKFASQPGERLRLGGRGGASEARSGRAGNRAFRKDHAQTKEMRIRARRPRGPLPQLQA